MNHREVIEQEYQLERDEWDLLDVLYSGEAKETIDWESGKNRFALEFYNIVDKFNGLLYDEINIQKIKKQGSVTEWWMDVEYLNESVLHLWASEIQSQVKELFHRVQELSIERVEGYWKMKMREKLV